MQKIEYPLGDYKLVFTHDAPLKKDLENLDEVIQTVNLELKIKKSRRILYNIKLEIKVHYWCSGSRNYDIEKVTVVKDDEDETGLIHSMIDLLDANKRKIIRLFNETMIGGGFDEIFLWLFDY